MHGLLVKLQMTGNPDDYKDAFTDYANALNQRQGFVSKTWITDEDMIGGFYIFQSRESAQSYVDEMLLPTVDQFDALSVQEIEYFPILQEYSEITHAPVGAVAADPAGTSLD